jgi:hypothetical protein
MREHFLMARSMDEQCPFATPNGDPPSVLHCALKQGHEDLGYGHVDTYEATAGEVKSWHKKWVRVPESELARLRNIGPRLGGANS